MRHGVFGRRLNRTRGHRTALFRNLARSLLLHERIETTRAKAKAVQPFVDRLVTAGKRGTLASRRYVFGELASRALVNKTMQELATRFQNRPGGYTRMRRIGFRQGDAAERVILELVDVPSVQKRAASKKRKGGGKDAKEKS